MADTAIIFQARQRMQLVSSNVQPSVSPAMSDAPTRDEITARLEAAEARTETRITQLGATMEARAVTADHKVDSLASKIDALMGAIGDMRADSKETRRAIWIVGIGAVLSVFALVVALWIAGINVQANMIATFQTALGVRAEIKASQATNPPVALPPSPAPPTSPAGK